MILLDTHSAIWFVTEDSSLGARARALAESTLFVSAIAFWEIALLASKRRLRAARGPAEQRATVMDAGIQELPLTGELGIHAVELNTLPGDPADRFIIATAIKHDATLMTADAALLGWRRSVRRIDASK